MRNVRAGYFARKNPRHTARVLHVMYHCADTAVKMRLRFVTFCAGVVE